MRVLDIPGYVEAVMRERFVRDVSLLGLEETINGFQVLPLTLRHYLILCIADSPFLPPFHKPRVEELETFLWLLNPNFSPDKKDKARFLKTTRCFYFPPEPIFKPQWLMKRHEARCDEVVSSVIKTSDAIEDYMREAMQDRPPQTECRIPRPSYYADAVGIIYALASEFKWSHDVILNLPLKLTFQLLSVIREAHYLKNGKTPVMFNPSDRVKNDYLVKLNESLKRN